MHVTYIKLTLQLIWINITSHQNLFFSLHVLRLRDVHKTNSNADFL
jgi:hypothetical protein